MDDIVISLKVQLRERLDSELNKLSKLIGDDNREAILITAGKIIELENLMQLCEKPPQLRTKSIKIIE